MNTIFIQFALVLGLSSGLGYFVHKLKLPLVIAYLIAGVLIASIGNLDSQTITIFNSLPDIGIAFVLFLIGMELDIWEIKALGRPIIMASLLQITISALAGFALANLFGLNLLQSFYLGVGLSFSSTVVVIKNLLEKKDLNSLHGKLLVGILLIEDIVALAVLMMISVGSSRLHLGLQQSLPLLAVIFKAVGLFLATFLLSKYLLGTLFKAVAKSTELLFLTALTWCFIFTALAQFLGFSVVIGAFLAGVALANSPYHLQIQGKVKPLRDFFVALFFVYLGSQTKIYQLALVWPQVLSFTAYALLIKPILFLSLLGVFGFRRYTLFQVGINLTQISEFSLIILLLGVKLGIMPNSTLSVMAAVAVLSITISSILVSSSRRIYPRVQKIIGFFEHTSKIHFLEIKDLDSIEDHIVIIGAHGVGEPIANYLLRAKIPFMIVDLNPHIVEKLHRRGMRAIYGDVTDPEILSNLQLERSRLIISTATSELANELILEEAKKRRLQAKIILRAPDREKGELLKKIGADYVIVPEKVSGDFLVGQLRDHWPNIRFNFES